jgi:hypothetical protein
VINIFVELAGFAELVVFAKPAGLSEYIELELELEPAQLFYRSRRELLVIFNSGSFKYLMSTCKFVYLMTGSKSIIPYNLIPSYMRFVDDLFSKH